MRSGIYTDTEIDEEIDHIDERLFYLFDVLYAEGHEELSEEVRQLLNELAALRAEIRTEVIEKSNRSESATTEKVSG